MTVPLRVAILSAGALLAALDMWAGIRQDAAWDILVLGSLPHAIYVVTGVILWSRRPDSRTGLLMVAAGYVGFVNGLWGLEIPLLITVSLWTQGLDGVIRQHMLLAYPSGRLTVRPVRWFVLFLYAYVLIYGATTRLSDVLPAAFGCLDCPPGALVLFHGMGWFDLHARIQEVADIVLLSAGSVILLYRWRRGSPAYRRVIGPVLLIGALPQNVFATLALTSWFNLSIDVRLTLIRAYLISIALVPLVILVGMLRTRVARGTVGDLVVQLQDADTPETMRVALARTLRDPSLEIAYYLPDGDTYVDSEGHPIVPPAPGPTRAVTMLEGGTGRLAALIHDPVLLEQPELIEAASAATRLAMENERLHAKIRAQLEEVQASRARIVQAADQEGRRIERDLHDGAQQRMLSLAMALRLIRKQSQAGDPELLTTIDKMEDDLKEALAELRDLAAGIHPAVLTESGLGGALTSLAERSVVPVSLVPPPEDRLPPAVEATVYFVVSEALTNVGKHSGAGRASVAVSRNNGSVTVEVVDDGVGGVDPAGSGLVGLSDRVAALGGMLRVESPPAGGTRLQASIPCE